MNRVHSGAEERASIPTAPVIDAGAGPAESLRNDRARAMFPAEWARMETLTGKRRSRLRASLRNRADYQAGMDALPAIARCGTCLHRDSYPGDGRPTCDLDSDFHGYQIVSLDHRCPRWVKARTANSAGMEAEGRNEPQDLPDTPTRGEGD